MKYYNNYGVKLNILLNPTNSHVFTICGRNLSVSLFLMGKDLMWCSKWNIFEHLFVSW